MKEKPKAPRRTTAKKSNEINTATKAEQMCASVAPDVKAQAITLANAVLTMQEKIETSIPDYQAQPLAQVVTVGTGESMLRANPATQEFRATVRDYAQALNNLKEIIENNKQAAGASAVEELRSRFKVG